MRFVPGPDLPTGGKIIGLDGVRKAYETGRGVFRIRATAKVTDVRPRKRGIVVTEMPYGVGPEKVIGKIKDLVQSRKLQGIADVHDLTDREHGLQLVIEVKNGFNAKAILDAALQTYVDGGAPSASTTSHWSTASRSRSASKNCSRSTSTIGLTSSDADRPTDVAAARNNCMSCRARLIAILDIDEVIAVIRSSDDTAAARTRLWRSSTLVRSRPMTFSNCRCVG